MTKAINCRYICTCTCTQKCTCIPNVFPKQFDAEFLFLGGLGVAYSFILIINLNTHLSYMKLLL